MAAFLSFFFFFFVFFVLFCFVFFSFSAAAGGLGGGGLTKQREFIYVSNYVGSFLVFRVISLRISAGFGIPVVFPKLKIFLD